MDVVFDQVQLDRIADDLPQLKEPICPAFLNSIRRNLYFGIVLESHASFMLLVESVVRGPAILAQSVERLVIEGPDEGIEYFGEIQRDSDIGLFFTRANRIEQLRLHRYPRLARFLITPFSVDHCISKVEALELGVFRLARGSTTSLASHFHHLGPLGSLKYLTLRYVPKEETNDEDDEEPEDNDVGSKGSGGSDRSDGSDCINCQDSDHEYLRSLRGKMEPEDKLNLILFFLAAPVSRPDTIELVCSMAACVDLDLVDTSTTSCDFFPLLDAIDSCTVSSLILRDYSRNMEPGGLSPRAINSALSRFVGLKNLRIGCESVEWDTLAATLAPLSILRNIIIEYPSAPTRSCLRSLISGPTKLKLLTTLDLRHIGASRGPAMQPGFDESFEIFHPARGWFAGR